MGETSGAGLRRMGYRFGGECQGVGFRYNTEHIANGLGITGWVRNEFDGTVSAELQGTSEQLAAFLGKLTETYARWHVDWRIAEAEELEPLPDEAGFSIRF